MFCPVAGQCVAEFMSSAGDSDLTLKLTQLHTFFRDHLATYEEQCVIPHPPSALIQEPQTIQVHTCTDAHMHGYTHKQNKEAFVVVFLIIVLHGLNKAY